MLHFSEQMRTQSFSLIQLPDLTLIVLNEAVSCTYHILSMKENIIRSKRNHHTKTPPQAQPNTFRSVRSVHISDIIVRSLHHPLLIPAPPLYRRRNPTRLELPRTYHIRVLINRSRNQRLLRGEEVAENGIRYERRGEPPDVEHVVNVFCAANFSFERRIDLGGHAGDVRHDGDEEGDDGAPIRAGFVVAIAAVGSVEAGDCMMN